MCLNNNSVIILDNWFVHSRTYAIIRTNVYKVFDGVKFMVF